MTQIDFEKRRAQMVDRHIAHRGVRSALVLAAMRSVPRERFLPEDLREFAYEDAPLPIAEGQTISQPYIVGTRDWLLMRSAITELCTTGPASNWDEPMQVKTVRPGLAGSYERLCHETGDPRFLLPLRGVGPTAPLAGLLQARLERAIGVIYRPETELQSHYFEAVLPHQLDEYIWFDETSAVTPLHSEELKGVPDTYPFGL